MTLPDLTTTAIFLDLDGTLIDIASDPHLVTIPADLVPVLSRLSIRLGGALAIITGRTIREIDRFLHPLRLPVAGVHGSEMRTMIDGEPRLTVGQLDPVVEAQVQQLSSLAPGVLVENKGYSIAVHFRRAQSAETQIKAELRKIVAGTPDHFVLAPGRCVIEVVPRYISKGTALQAFMEMAAFKRRKPIMIGDDIPDESALAAAVRLGGRGLRVAGEHFRERADFEGPAEVRAWLASMVELSERA
jgi:trehalose 6-phosphate phosphatase